MGRALPTAHTRQRLFCGDREPARICGSDLHTGLGITYVKVRHIFHDCRPGWKLRQMRLTYDLESDAAFVYLVDVIPPGSAPRSHMCDVEFDQAAVVMLFSPEDKLVGLEVVGASRVLPREVLDTASPW